MRLTAALAVLLIAATVIPLSPSTAWWVRALDFPRMQIALLLAGWLALAFFAGLPSVAIGRLLMLAAAACLAYQAYFIIPYTPLASKQSQDSAAPRAETSMRLLFANVLQTNRNAAALLEIIAESQPDLVLTLETDAWWMQQLTPLRKNYPHVVLQPQDNTYGMLLYSKYPLVDPRVRFVVQRDVPSIHTKVRLPSGVLLDLYCVHPRPPFPSEATESTPRDVELILLGREVEVNPGPVVVMGDLNDVGWSATSRLFQRTSRLLDPRVGRGLYNSFPADIPLFRFPLDHYFHSDDLRLVGLRRLGKFGSDHFPMLIHLNYEPQAKRVQEAPGPPP